MAISVIVLTFNAAETVARTLDSVASISDDIHVVDSFSTDATLEIARAKNAKITQHEFLHYGAQRNWASQNLPLRHDWELHLDADERLTEMLVAEIAGLDLASAEVDGYYITRLVHFLGHPIRHGGMYPLWHMRLFRHGRGRCEMRRYDQHFHVDGRAARLRHPMIDDIRMTLTEWTVRHNRWSDAEVRQILDTDREGELVEPSFFGTPPQRQRALRRLYMTGPRFLAPFLLFFYRYVLRFGFLDGRAGFVFYVLQTFWFRFLIDAKLYEWQLANRGADELAQVQGAWTE